MVGQAVAKSVEALKRRDLELAKRIHAGDEQVNKKRFSIENDTLTIIATQQPIARDLRILASVLEVITELERMGDYAKGIAKITIALSSHPPLPFPEQISRMSQLSVDMLRRAVDAFVDHDTQAALLIPVEDDLVDTLYNETNRALIALIVADPAATDRANYLMWAAHNLERMADRVTNICERAIFIVTGRLEEMDNSDNEIVLELPA
jgi:phosphate transport system protein